MSVRQADSGQRAADGGRRTADGGPPARAASGAAGATNAPEPLGPSMVVQCEPPTMSHLCAAVLLLALFAGSGRQWPGVQKAPLRRRVIIGSIAIVVCHDCSCESLIIMFLSTGSVFSFW